MRDFASTGFLLLLNSMIFCNNDLITGEAASLKSVRIRAHARRCCSMSLLTDKLGTPIYNQVCPPRWLPLTCLEFFDGMQEYLGTSNVS